MTIREQQSCIPLRFLFILWLLSSVNLHYLNHEHRIYCVIADKILLVRELEAATSVGVFEMIDRSDAPTLARARSGVRPPPISAHEFESFFSLDGALPFPPLRQAHFMISYW